MPAIEEDVQLGLITVIVVSVGVVGYFIYDKLFTSSGSQAVAQATDTEDPTTGLSNGIANAIDNSIFTDSFSGGGEVSDSSETFTGAASEVLSSPIGSLESIFGINPAN